MNKTELNRARKRLIALAILDAQSIASSVNINPGVCKYKDLVVPGTTNRIIRAFPGRRRYKNWRLGKIAIGSRRRVHNSWWAFRDKWRANGLDVCTMKLMDEVVHNMTGTSCEHS